MLQAIVKIDKAMPASSKKKEFPDDDLSNKIKGRAGIKEKAEDVQYAKQSIVIIVDNLVSSNENDETILSV